MQKINTAALFKGERRALAKAITMVESTKAEHRVLATQLLNQCLPHSGHSLRIGISGVPGVGKSTFIETFGLFLIGLGKKVGVLAVDPSSPLHGGSILGDKTRMERLSREERAFIRPSPAGRSLGGVANRTRETILVAESAGFDIILVETVGVGQSEYEVQSMTDLFLVLMQPGAGDELQGIKKGILELADFIVVNKADGEAARLAKQSEIHYKNAINFLNHQGFWKPEVLSISSLESKRIENLWARIQAYCDSGLEAIPARRTHQASMWFERLLSEGVTDLLRTDSNWLRNYESVKKAVSEGSIAAPQAFSDCIKPLKDAMNN